MPADNHAGQRVNAIQRARVESHPPSAVRDSPLSARFIRSVSSLRGIQSLVQMVEAPRRAADEADLRHHDQRECDLHDDERLPQATSLCRLGAAIALAQLVHIGPRHAQRGQECEPVLVQEA